MTTFVQIHALRDYGPSLPNRGADGNAAGRARPDAGPVPVLDGRRQPRRARQTPTPRRPRPSSATVAGCGTGWTTGSWVSIVKVEKM